jgi:hypothetical protein
MIPLSLSSRGMYSALPAQTGHKPAKRGANGQVRDENHRDTKTRCFMLIAGLLFAISGSVALAQTPITPSGLNTAVSAPISLPSGQIQFNITGGTEPVAPLIPAKTFFRAGLSSDRRVAPHIAVHYDPGIQQSPVKHRMRISSRCAD